MSKHCPIGLEDCIPRGQNSCVNFSTCYAWTRPWPLPLSRITWGVACLDSLTFDSSYWLVEFLTLYPPINSAGIMQQRDWKKYFADYGYAEAVPLRN